MLETNYISKKEKIQGSEQKTKERCSSSKTTSTKTIPQYFYMPITRAAKEPNLGLAPLKKRCREPEVDEPLC